jgi:ABC-2 type transport system ATP-binding protein
MTFTIPNLKETKSQTQSASPQAGPAIVIHQLQKRYGAIEAVKQVSLSVQPGEIFGLLGPNGTGKTTTLRCLCTLMLPDAGSLEVFGISVTQNPSAVRQCLGYVAQEVALDKMMTGRELLEMHADLYHLTKAQRLDRVQSVLQTLDLLEYADRLIGGYSGGLKKRLDLAAGLLHNPAILVLDEPTAGLDIESRQIMWQLIRQLRQSGTTILITSHYLEEIDALADRVAILDRGTVIASGTPQELKQAVGGDRVTVRIREFTTFTEAEQAKEALLKLPIVKSMTINEMQGNSLNLVVEPQSDVLLQIQAQLEALDLPIFGIARSQPSLEDVYLSVTGQCLNEKLS